MIRTLQRGNQHGMHSPSQNTIYGDNMAINLQVSSSSNFTFYLNFKNKNKKILQRSKKL